MLKKVRKKLINNSTLARVIIYFFITVFEMHSLSLYLISLIIC